MESENYILWSVKASGWLSKGGNYTSTRADADTFTLTRALEMCKRHKGNRAEFGLIPVSLELLEMI